MCQLCGNPLCPDLTPRELAGIQMSRFDVVLAFNDIIGQLGRIRHMDEAKQDFLMIGMSVIMSSFNVPELEIATAAIVAADTPDRPGLYDRLIEVLLDMRKAYED